MSIGNRSTITTIISIKIFKVHCVADQITKTTAELIPATILSMDFFDRLTKAGRDSTTIHYTV